MLSQLGSKFPSVAKLTSSVSSNPGELNAIRSQIWTLRSQYWLGRIQSVPNTFHLAREELKSVCNSKSKIVNPQEWTWGDVISGSIFGAQIVGAFYLGEATKVQLTTGNLFGYDDAGAGAQHH